MFGKKEKELNLGFVNEYFKNEYFSIKFTLNNYRIIMHKDGVAIDIHDHAINNLFFYILPDEEDYIWDYMDDLGKFLEKYFENKTFENQLNLEKSFYLNFDDTAIYISLQSGTNSYFLRKIPFQKNIIFEKDTSIKAGLTSPLYLLFGIGSEDFIFKCNSSKNSSFLSFYIRLKQAIFRFQENSFKDKIPMMR